MAPHDEATLRRLQYTVYLTGVFLSIPWKRLLSLNHKQQKTELKRLRKHLGKKECVSTFPVTRVLVQSTWQHHKSMLNCNNVQFHNRFKQRSQKLCAFLSSQYLAKKV